MANYGHMRAPETALWPPWGQDGSEEACEGVRGPPRVTLAPCAVTGPHG